MYLKFRSTLLAFVGVILFSLAHSKPAQAATTYTLNAVTITSVGCQVTGVGTGQCFLTTSTPPLSSLNCGTVIYIFFDSSGINQAMYASAIMALSTGKSAIVNYSQPSGAGTQCVGSLVQVTQ
jgi:hypothetical protein